MYIRPLLAIQRHLSNLSPVTRTTQPRQDASGSSPGGLDVGGGSRGQRDGGPCGSDAERGGSWPPGEVDEGAYFLLVLRHSLRPAPRRRPQVQGNGRVGFIFQVSLLMVFWLILRSDDIDLCIAWIIFITYAIAINK